MRRCRKPPAPGGRRNALPATRHRTASAAASPPRTGAARRRSLAGGKRSSRQPRRAANRRRRARVRPRRGRGPCARRSGSRAVDHRHRHAAPAPAPGGHRGNRTRSAAGHLRAQAAPSQSIVAAGADAPRRTALARQRHRAAGAAREHRQRPADRAHHRARRRRVAAALERQRAGPEGSDLEDGARTVRARVHRGRARRQPRPHQCRCGGAGAAADQSLQEDPVAAEFSRPRRFDPDISCTFSMSSGRGRT